MMANRAALCLGLVCVLGASVAMASQLGDPAPALDVAEWIKGEPVDLAAGKGKNIYVVAFWTTSSSHAKAAIPELTEMQKKYADKNVVILAISPEDKAPVEAAVKEMGDKVGIPIAIDNNRAMLQAYLGGFAVQSVPYAFVVDKKGAIVWHGHPMLAMTKAIDALIEGTYDIEVRKRVEQARVLIPKYFEMVSSPAKMNQAGRLGERILTDGADDPMLMNVFAWSIMAQPGVIKRDRQLALRAIEAAYDGSGGKDAGILDTYARVLFELGRKEDAIEMQQRAVDLAEGHEMQKELKETLEKYKKEGD